MAEAGPISSAFGIESVCYRLRLDDCDTLDLFDVFSPFHQSSSLACLETLSLMIANRLAKCYSLKFPDTQRPGKIRNLQ